MFTPNPKSKHVREDTGTADEYVSRALECLRGNRAHHLANTGAHASAIYWLTNALKIYVERVHTLEDQHRGYQAIIASLRSEKTDA